MKSCLECQYSKRSYPDGDMDDPLCALECTLTGEDLGYGDNFPVPNLCPLTEEGCLYHHRKLWNWIADETLRQHRKVKKEEYFDHIGIADPLHDCYCCQYASTHALLCRECIIEWNNGRWCGGSTQSPYVRWKQANNYEAVATYARQVAQLPARQGGHKNA